jgi:hypothetical protein
MDLLTHALLTRKLVSKRFHVLLAGVGPDVPWYFTYPVWVVAQGKAHHALTSSEWPDPPPWMETLHHACHSLPVALVGAALTRMVSGQWPREALLAWVLHIAVDAPTHSRRFWGPRFLWPLSNVAIDGVPWAEVTSRALAAVLRTLWAKLCLPWVTGL